MNKAPVHVVCASNMGYIMPLCVLLVSVVDNFDPTRELVLNVISNDATDEHKSMVSRSIEMVRPGSKNVQVRWYGHQGLDLGKFEALREKLLTPDTFVRLFLTNLLPADCKRVIYLDCDMVVLADLAKLFDETAQGGYLLHAVQDMGQPKMTGEAGVFDYVERGIAPDAPYFNAGVLVIDLELWRKRNLTPQMVDYLVTFADKINFADQGTLNAFLHADWKPLDFRWNQVPCALQEASWMGTGHPRETWESARSTPFIAHFLGPNKPWAKVTRHAPRRLFFYRYLAKTVFKGTVGRYPYLEHLLGYPAYFRLWLFANKILPYGFRLRSITGRPARRKSKWPESGKVPEQVLLA